MIDTLNDWHDWWNVFCLIIGSLMLLMSIYADKPEADSVFGILWTEIVAALNLLPRAVSFGIGLYIIWQVVIG